MEDIKKPDQEVLETSPEKSGNKDLAPEGQAQQKQRVFVVLNPVAGTSDCETTTKTIQAFCEEHGWDCDIHETQKDEDLRQLIRSEVKKGIDMVLASGGDGTVSAVVSGMVNSNVPLGILPAGSGNALARDLNIPINLEAALALLAGEHRVMNMDAMKVNDDYYVMNASIGISAKIMKNTTRSEKRKFGFLAYLRHAINNMMKARMHRFSAEVDQKTYKFAASEVMVANEKLMKLQPQIEGVEIDPNDGKLDMFIVRAQGLRDYLGVITRFVFKRNPEDDTKLRYLAIEDYMLIDATPPHDVQADGEVIGKTPVTLKLVRDALKVIVPEPEKKE